MEVDERVGHPSGRASADGGADERELRDVRREAGSTRAVTEREADDLVRDADRFLAVVEQALGLAPHVPQLPLIRAAVG